MFVLGCFLANANGPLFVCLFLENQNSKYRVYIKVTRVLRKIKEMKQTVFRKTQETNTVLGHTKLVGIWHYNFGES